MTTDISSTDTVVPQPSLAELLVDLAPTPAAYLRVARAIADGAYPELRPVRVAVLSTFTAEFLGPYLAVEGARRGLALTPWFGPWGQLEEQTLDASSELYAAQPDVIVVLARIEELLPEAVHQYLSMTEAARITNRERLLERLSGLLVGIRSRTSVPVFLANFAPPSPAAGLADVMLPDSQDVWFNQLSTGLVTLCRGLPETYVFDYARLVAEHGSRAMQDARLFFMGRIPFSQPAQIVLARRLARLCRAALIPPAKVLALDLDNTLWGGVLGEDGVGGIKLGDEYPGNVFKTWQRYLITLKDRGVLLVAVSKNNREDAEEAFAKHEDMVVKWDDFAATRVNWEPKSENLRSLAAELNVGLDSFVFVDDSSFEREEVSQALPMVRVLPFPKSPMGLIESVEESGHFDALTISAEDRIRARQYREQAQRVAAEGAARSPEDFLRSLELVATIGFVNGETLPRVAQLLAKTNQFNLTTRRHNAAQIDSMIASRAVAIWVRLADRFGDHGLVGVAISVPEESGSDIWRIDTLLMSCRVLGRGVEQSLLAFLSECVRERGGRLLIGEYVKSAKNAQVADFYLKQSFERRAESETEWVWDLEKAAVKRPEFISINIVKQCVT